MKTVNLKQIIKIIFLIVGAAILINGIALFFVSNLNTGNFLTVILGGAVIVFAALFHKIAKWIKTVFIIGLALVVCFVGFLIIYGKIDNVTYKEDAVIVLGAALHGETPSLTLKRRLDCAMKYHNQNPDALIIVSGGKGDMEEITEAAAMEKYLLQKNVPQDKIIKEENAASTYENFKYSKDILDRQFDGAYTAAFITNEYHILRAGMCAEFAELKNTAHYHSNTTLSYLLSGTLRECLAVIKCIVFKN